MLFWIYGWLNRCQKRAFNSIHPCWFTINGLKNYCSNLPSINSFESAEILDGRPVTCWVICSSILLMLKIGIGEDGGVEMVSVFIATFSDSDSDGAAWVASWDWDYKRRNKNKDCCKTRYLSLIPLTTPFWFSESKDYGSSTVIKINIKITVQ